LLQDFEFTEAAGADAFELAIGGAPAEGKLPAGVIPWEVLQLCSHPVIGWLDAPPGIFGLRSIQVAAI
jgi:hypothetical protein